MRIFFAKRFIIVAFLFRYVLNINAVFFILCLMDSYSSLMSFKTFDMLRCDISFIPFRCSRLRSGPPPMSLKSVSLLACDSCWVMSMVLIQYVISSCSSFLRAVSSSRFRFHSCHCSLGLFFDIGC